MEITQVTSAMAQVEEDHQLVADKLTALRETLACLTEAGQDPLPAVKRLQEVTRKLSARISAHVAQQEVHLLPYLQNNLPDEPDLVAELREEHDAIKSKLAEMNKCLNVAGELEDEIPHAVVLDLIGYGWEVWELLDRHAHRETTAIGRCFAKFLQTVPGM